MATARRVSRILEQRPKPWRINFGCGTNPLAGFLNVDLGSTAREVVRHDVRRPLPGPSGEFAGVYTEHMIEHLTLAEGAAFLRDCHRLLEPGGCLRVATPDLAAFVRMYLQPEDPDREAYEAFFHSRNPGLADLPRAPILMLNAIASDHGHRFVYDEPYLASLLRHVGFGRVERRRVGESEIPEFRGIESHGRIIGERPNEIETMVLEAWR